MSGVCGIEQLLSLWIIGQHEHKDIFFYNRFQVFTVLDIDLAQNCTVRHLKLNFKSATGNC